MPQILSLDEAYGGAPQADSPVLHSDFGAPGSTAEDRAAGIFSEADINVRTPGQKAEPVATKPKVPSKVISLDEAYGGPQMDTGIKRVGKEAAQVVDIVAGFPAFLAKIGTRGALDTFFAVTGEAHPMAKSAEITDKAMKQPWMKFMAAPIQFMTDIDPSGTTMEAFTQKLGGFTETVAESAQQAYGGEGGEFAKRGIDIGMAKGGEYLARGAKALKGEAGKPPPTEPPPVDLEPAPRPEPTPGTLFGKDAEWNAKNKAYDLMQSGASVKEVLAAVKRNPLVGKELDKFMQRRAEVREGPMKETLQGEVLSAEEARAQAAAEHPDPAAYGRLVQEAAQERIRQAEQPKQLEPPLPKIFRTGRRETPPEQPGGTEAEAQAVRDSYKPPEPEEPMATGEEVLKSAQERTSQAWARRLPKQAGNADPDFVEKLGKLALTGTAVPLGALMKTANYTAETLKRLPQNRFEFKKETIEATLKQQDITKAERDTFQAILADTPGDTITAKQLTDGFKVATQDFQLEKAYEPRYADYGLGNIRSTNGYMAESTLNSASTNLWRLPDHMKVSDANHFGDDRLYGWTRVFKEEEVPHVVEIQSDLMQHTKALGDLEREQVETSLATHRKTLNELEGPWTADYKNISKEVLNTVTDHIAGELPEHIDASIPNNLKSDMSKEGSINYLNFLKSKLPAKEYHGLLQNAASFAASVEELSIRELEAKLAGGSGSEKLSPIIKHWPRRLIREELADAAKQDIPFVRFATADTVAKVEGWPNAVNDLAEVEAKIKRIDEELSRVKDEQLRSDLMYSRRNREGERAVYEDQLKQGNTFVNQHQSIYDRYAKDITPYLRRLGGRDYTDSKGHTWIQVPTPKGPPSMYGHADPKLLARIAAAGVGATLGMYFADDKYKGALLGAFGGLVLSKVNPREAVAYMKKAVQPDNRIRVNDIGDVWESTVEGSRIIHDKLNRDIRELVPDPNRRAAISHWIEGDKKIKLDANEMKAAKKAQDFFAQMKDAGFDAEVLKSARENYVTHIWEWGLQGKGKVEAALARKGTGMSPRTPYAKERTIDTLAEGKKMGLTPRTEDIGEIVEAYGNSMAQAIANKNFLTGLKAAKTPDGRSLALPAKDAPHTYGFVNHPQLHGMRFHPDIIPSLEFMFDHPPGLGGRAVEAFNTTLKRLSVSFSLFHVKALLDVHLATLKNPLKIFTEAAGFATGKDMYLQELKQQGLGPTIKRAVDAGLKFSLEGKAPKVEDVGQGNTFYDAMVTVQKAMDATVPYSGKAAEAFIKVNHAADTLTWARMHTGMKLKTFMANYEKVLTNNAKAYAKNPAKVKLMSEGEAAKIAASVTNDLYGGLNWRRVAEGVNNRVGRDIALWALKPSSRRILNVGLFALDWTVSTVKPWFGMLKKGSGVQGLLKPRTEADLYRQYVARSLIYYTIIGDGLNLALSGHHLWENRDPTRVDHGDGRTIQWSKHTMEPIHWLTNTMQQFLNKMGILPRQALEQATGVEYLTAHGTSPPMKGSRLEHLGKGLTPISVQQNFQAGSSAGIMGMLGMPVYGKTREQRIEERMQKRLESLSPEARKKAREEHLKNLEYRR